MKWLLYVCRVYSCSKAYQLHLHKLKLKSPFNLLLYQMPAVSPHRLLHILLSIAKG